MGDGSVETDGNVQMSPTLMMLLSAVQKTISKKEEEEPGWFAAASGAQGSGGPACGERDVDMGPTSEEPVEKPAMKKPKKGKKNRKRGKGSAA